MVRLFGISPAVRAGRDIIAKVSAELTRRLACHALEELGEERGIGEIKLITDAGNGLVAVLEFNLDAGDQGIVYPLLGTLAAHLANDGAHVTWREAQA